MTPDNNPLYEYTLMPMRMRSLFAVRDLKKWDRHDGFTFTKGCKIMKVPGRTASVFTKDNNPVGKARMATLLFDLVEDPRQVRPLSDTKIEMKMIELLVHAL